MEVPAAESLNTEVQRHGNHSLQLLDAAIERS
jgi:hypothetical protein